LVGVVIKNLRWQAGTTLVVGGVVLAGVAVALVIQLDVSKVAEIGRKMIIGRLENDASSIDSNYRTTLVLSAIQQFADEPFLGSSLVEKNSGEYPHNLIVESFMATGVVGGIMFVAVLVIGLNSAVRILRFQPTAIWVALIFIQNVIGAQFSGSLWGSYQFWCFALAMLALGRIKTLGQVSGAVANHGIDADRLRTFPGRLAPILPRVGPAR
jgi:O-antigen ligase